MVGSRLQHSRCAGACRRFAGKGAVLLALLFANGRSLAITAGTFALPPSMFPLDPPGPAGIEAAGELTLFRSVRLSDPPVPRGGIELRLEEPAAWHRLNLSGSLPPATTTAYLQLGRPLRPWATGVVMAATLAVSLQNSLKEQSELPFHVTREGFFSPDTYTGGADKASHFVDYAAIERIFETTYRRFGYTDGESRWLALGTSVATGLATEIGDGTTVFGFSWEDLLMDTLGALSSAGLAHSRWDDAFGFRAGWSVPQQTRCCASDHVGRDYSGEIYTADVKIAGLGNHLRYEPGLARYFLFSVTYGTNGYRYAPPELRQRLIGFEIGIHFSEILRSLGVPRQSLLGEVLYLFFDTVRLPYTSIGVRYDLNHHQWFGPTAGRTAFPSH